jgi:serine/threonine protein kinase
MGDGKILRSELAFDEERDVIGRGNFRTVCKGVWRGNIEVAIKGRDFEDYEIFESDYSLPWFLLHHHPHLVIVYGVCIERNSMLLVMEFLEKGSLKSYLRDHARQETLFKDLIQIGENIASGMTELSRLGIVHRELAARNVLLDPWLRAKVGYFGLACDKNYGEIPLSVRWTAPEAILKRKFTTKSDVWSFGVVMWEILTFGDNPYDGKY